MSIHLKTLRTLDYTTIIMSHIAPLITPPTAKLILNSRTATRLSTPRVHNVFVCSSSTLQQQTHVQRRSVALGLAGLVLGLGAGVGNGRAAARRPPPPPPEEKTDPNVTGLAAKVMASKKRKEAMKESIAKLREKGKPIRERGEPVKESIQEPSE